MPSLGDSLKNLSLHVYFEMQHLLSLMRNQDPELRTTEFRYFIAKTKKRILQMLAICRWLNEPGVLNVLNSINSFNGKISLIENGINRNLDELYFIHASMFSMRSRPLDVVLAKQILALSNYSNLPQSIFSCGAPKLPNDINIFNGDGLSEKEISSIRNDLNIFIRAKLHLNDLIPFHDYPTLQVNIKGGVLNLTFPYYFTIYITLTTFEILSQWNIIDFRILMNCFNDEIHQPDKIEYNYQTIEKETVDIIRKKISSNSINLKRIINICRHVAISTGLRLIYIQSLNYTHKIMDGFVVSSFSEQNDASYFTFKFWNRKKSNRDFLVSLQLYQPRQPSEPNYGLKLCLLLNKDDDQVLQVLNIDPHVVNAESFVSVGTNFIALFESVLQLCISFRMMQLFHCLKYTIQEINNPVLSKIFKIELDSNKIMISRQSEDQMFDIKIFLFIDARSGYFTSDSIGLSDILASDKRSFDLLLAEINNINSERQFIDSFLQYDLTKIINNNFEMSKISYFGYKISTLEPVLMQLELVNWNNEIDDLSIVLVKDSDFIRSINDNCILVYHISTFNHIDIFEKKYNYLSQLLYPNGFFEYNNNDNNKVNPEILSLLGRTMNKSNILKNINISFSIKTYLTISINSDFLISSQGYIYLDYNQAIGSSSKQNMKMIKNKSFLIDNNNNNLKMTKSQLFHNLLESCKDLSKEVIVQSLDPIIFGFSLSTCQFIYHSNQSISLIHYSNKTLSISFFNTMNTINNIINNDIGSNSGRWLYRYENINIDPSILRKIGEIKILLFRDFLDPTESLFRFKCESVDLTSSLISPKEKHVYIEVLIYRLISDTFNKNEAIQKEMLQISIFKLMIFLRPLIDFILLINFDSKVLSPAGSIRVVRVVMKIDSNNNNIFVPFLICSVDSFSIEKSYQPIGYIEISVSCDMTKSEDALLVVKDILPSRFNQAIAYQLLQTRGSDVIQALISDYKTYIDSN